MNLQEKFLNYIKDLAERHVDFLHDDDGRKAYFEFDWNGMTGCRNRNNVVVFVQGMEGELRGNKGDYRSDKIHWPLMFLTKRDPLKGSQHRSLLFTCKNHGEEFINKMREERSDPESDLDLCELLRHVDLDDVQYSELPPIADGWLGVEFRIPVVTSAKNTTDPEKWR